MSKARFSIGRRRQYAVVLLTVFALLVISVVPAFAQATPVPPPTTAELLTDSVDFVNQFGVMVAVFAVLIMAMGVWVWTRMKRGAK